MVRWKQKHYLNLIVWIGSRKITFYVLGQQFGISFKQHLKCVGGLCGHVVIVSILVLVFLALLCCSGIKPIGVPHPEAMLVCLGQSIQKRRNHNHWFCATSSAAWRRTTLTQLLHDTLETWWKTSCLLKDFMTVSFRNGMLVKSEI